MNVVHALQPLQKSIFLAGPTPRDPETKSWRPEALELLQRLGFDGTVFVPEADDWVAHDNYDAQVSWELAALNQATVVAFWIPRDLVTMPAFTTNVEFGMLVNSSKAILGYPENAPKIGYLAHLAGVHGVPVERTLNALLDRAMHLADETHRQALRGYRKA